MPSAVRGGKKPSILLWHDLNLEQLHKVKHSTDKLSTLAEIFGLQNYKHDLRSAILLDLYFYAQQFSEKKGFNDEQTSAFISIVKSVHEKGAETPYGNVDDTFKYFKELLLCHSVKRPPFSVQLYSTDQVQMIADYVVNTWEINLVRHSLSVKPRYFKHYKLYKYAFTPKVRLDLTFDYIDSPETPIPDQDEEQVNDEQKVDGSEEVNTDISPQVNQTVEEDSPAIKELKNLITTTLTQHVNQLRLNVEEQLKASNEMLSQKFGFPCGEKETPKSPKGNKKKGK